jgi:hypothetical protein
VTPYSLPRDFDPRASPRGGPALGELSDSRRTAVFAERSSALARADVAAKPSPGGDWPTSVRRDPRRRPSPTGKISFGEGKAWMLTCSANDRRIFANIFETRSVRFAIPPRCGNPSGGGGGEEEESGGLKGRARREKSPPPFPFDHGVREISLGSSSSTEGEGRPPIARACSQPARRRLEYVDLSGSGHRAALSRVFR